MTEIETLKRNTSTLFCCFIFVFVITISESETGACPDDTVKVPNSNICIEKVNPTRLADFKEIAMYCLSKHLDICLAEQIIKACQEGSIKVTSGQSSIVFLTSSGMYARIAPDCNISKTGPIGPTEKEHFLCCEKIAK
jgi:hypothetical protein